ncbi:MAG: aminotransferase class IV [Leptolyngbyaceae bacterium]|nr:aminotransferase class IV [Leptolyngbyaceae bacterium]
MYSVSDSTHYPTPHYPITHYPMYWYTGQLIEADAIALPISDPALLYGATIFTTMRVEGRSLDHPLSFWSAHCDRLHTSLQQLGWVEPNWPRLRLGAEQMAAHHPILRLTIFPDGREWITGRSLPPNLAEWQQSGIAAWLAPPQWGRSLPGHKTGNYLAPWLALQQAQQQGCQEAILTDCQGNWLETSTGNLWGWSDNCWWTPSLRMADGDAVVILPGVARSHLMAVLKWHNMEIQECIWSSDRVAQFEAVVYANSVRRIVAIAQVHGSNYEKLPGLRFQPCHPKVRAIATLFNTVTPHL